MRTHVDSRVASRLAASAWAVVFRRCPNSDYATLTSGSGRDPSGPTGVRFTAYVLRRDRVQPKK